MGDPGEAGDLRLTLPRPGKRAFHARERLNPKKIVEGVRRFQKRDRWAGVPVAIMTEAALLQVPASDRLPVGSPLAGGQDAPTRGPQNEKTPWPRLPVGPWQRSTRMKFAICSIHLILCPVGWHDARIIPTRSLRSHPKTSAAAVHGLHRERATSIQLPAGGWAQGAGRVSIVMLRSDTNIGAIGAGRAADLVAGSVTKIGPSSLGQHREPFVLGNAESRRPKQDIEQ